MENTHTKDKVMRSALVLLVLLAVIFAGSLIFAGKNSSNNRNENGPISKATDSARELESRLSKAIVNVGGVHLTASIADTKQSRESGLSNLHSIGPNEGKVFVFEEMDFHAIWTQDMLFPIDVIWVNDQNTVVDIRENLAPESYPDTFKPAYPASKVIEVNAGWVAEHGVKVGDTFSFTKLH